MIENQVEEVASGVTWYCEPMGARMLNFYALDDNGRVVLFDAGLPGTVLKRIDAGEIAGEPGRLIVSHSDADHLGDGAALRERYPHLVIACHRADSPLVEDHDLLVKERYDYARPRFRYGYEQDVLDGLRAACGANVSVDSLLEAGEEVHIGERTWTVLHSPGHSPGHISLWHEPEGILIFGDAVLGYGPPDAEGRPSMPPTHQYIADYLGTIDMFSKLPVQLALNGHWQPMDGQGFQTLVNQSRECVMRDLDLVQEACSGRAQTFAALVDLLNERFRTWPQSEDANYFYAAAGYIEYLAGKHLLVEKDGGYLYASN